MIEYREITAKFQGTCSECGRITEINDTLLWSKGNGAKHKECPQVYLPSYQMEIDNDYSNWKDKQSHTYKEAQSINNCQKCNVSLSGKDRYLRGDDGIGFRAVCEEHS